MKFDIFAGKSTAEKKSVKIYEDDPTVTPSISDTEQHHKSPAKNLAPNRDVTHNSSKTPKAAAATTRRGAARSTRKTAVVDLSSAEKKSSTERATTRKSSRSSAKRL